MMTSSIKYVYLLAVFVLPTATCLAQDNSELLKKNPFSQPDTLKLQPRVTAPVMTPEPEELPEFSSFVLSATLISVNQPMAVVNGELLMIGEEVRGMRLILVDDSRAVIRYRGKLYDITVDDNNNQKIRKKR